MTKFKDGKGYVNVPSAEWARLTDRQCNEVKNFNRSLKWKCRQNSDNRNGDRGQKILGRAIIYIFQEVVETDPQNRDEDPDTGKELDTRREIVPKFVFKVKKA